MTTPNGHHQVDVFEGVELPPDAETQALLELMALADDVEAGRLTDEGHQRAREALAVLRRGVEREPSSFRQAVALAQTNLRGSLETLTRAIETANPLRGGDLGAHDAPAPAVAGQRIVASGPCGAADRRGRGGEIPAGLAAGRWGGIWRRPPGVDCQPPRRHEIGECGAHERRQRGLRIMGG